MRGRTIDEMEVGDTAELSRVASPGDVAEFVDSIGDHNPIHHDREYAAKTKFAKPLVPGMWTASLVSAVLGTRLPGPGCIYVAQQVEFTRPVYVGDEITAHVEVIERKVESNRVRLKTLCVNQRGEQVVVGEAMLSPPKTPVAYATRTTGTVAVTHWALQPWLCTAQAASTWLRVTTSALSVWIPTSRPPSTRRE